MCKIKDLASYILAKCTADACPIDNARLQQVLYFLQVVWCNKTRGELLFNEEFTAWKFGPVNKSIYEHYFPWGCQKILADSEAPFPLPESLYHYIDNGIEILRNARTATLLEKTHIPDGPWYKTYDHGRGNNAKIPNELIIDYYGKHLALN